MWLIKGFISKMAYLIILVVALTVANWIHGI